MTASELRTLLIIHYTAMYLFYFVICFIDFIQIVIRCHWSCNLADCF